MGKKDKKSKKITQERLRQQKAKLQNLELEFDDKEQQLLKYKKRNQNLVVQIYEVKDNLKTIEQQYLNTQKGTGHTDQDEVKLPKKKNEKEDQKEQTSQSMVDDMIEVELDTICTKTLDHYIEPLTKQNLSIQVEHQGNRAVFELKNENYTFGDIKQPIAQYFALPNDVIFFKNDKDEVLLSNLKVLPTLFPLLNSKIKGENPVLQIALKCNMSTLDYILGDEQAKQALQMEQDEQEKIHQNNLKQSQQRDQSKQKEEDMKKDIEKNKKKQKCYKLAIGLTESTIFLMFTLFQILLCVSQRDVTTAYFNRLATKSALFDTNKEFLVFTNSLQMLTFLKIDFYQNLIDDPNDDTLDVYWTQNVLLPYFRVQQIRGVKRPCSWSGRKGFQDFFEGDFCAATYYSGDFDKQRFNDTDYESKQTIVQSRGTLQGYSEIGYFKQFTLNLTDQNWYDFVDHAIDKSNYIDNQTLVFFLTFNIMNPNNQLLIEFHNMFQFYANGLIVMEYDTLIINTKLFQVKFQVVLSALICVIGCILLIVSIIDIRRQSKQQEITDEMLNNNNNNNNAGGTEELLNTEDIELQIKPQQQAKKKCSCKKVKISIFELINLIMIFFTFISVGIKYYYDYALDVTGIHKEVDQHFVSFSLLYLFYEAIFFFDTIIIFMMAISITKYTFFWIPSLSLITSSLQTYLNATIKKIIYFILALSFAFATFCHFISSYFAFGFQSYIYALVRTNLLIVTGNLYSTNKIFLSKETLEYIYSRSGWVITLISLGLIHIFGRYVILNIIVAFMKKDITDTKEKLEKISKLEMSNADEVAKENFRKRQQQSNI